MMLEMMTSEEIQAFEAAVASTSAAVEEELDHLLPPPDDSDESRLFEAMRYSIFTGGKRVRPFLVMTTNALLGGNKKRALRVAAAMECLHAYSLIHDDLPALDDDDTRRGKPTCHIEFDEATAVLAGDALQAFAFDILSDKETHADAGVRAHLVNLFAKAAGPYGMVGGQMMDIMAEQRDRTEDYDQGALARLQRKKTGALFSACCEASLLLNGGTNEEYHRLLSYAKNIGLAFQMVDDLLDVTGDEAVVGKKVGKDEGRGKITFTQLLGVEGAQRQSHFLCSQAVDYLRPFGEKAEELRLLAKFVVQRNK